MDKIIVKNLRVSGIIGIYEQERIIPQEILINLTLYTDIHDAAAKDDIVLCVDYEKVSNTVRQLAQTAQRATVEALAEDIASTCLSVPGVSKVKVRLEKTQAIAFTDSVGVEIKRKKQ